MLYTGARAARSGSPRAGVGAAGRAGVRFTAHMIRARVLGREVRARARGRRRGCGPPHPLDDLDRLLDDALDRHVLVRLHHLPRLASSPRAVGKLFSEAIARARLRRLPAGGPGAAAPSPGPARRAPAHVPPALPPRRRFAPRAAPPSPASASAPSPRIRPSRAMIGRAAARIDQACRRSAVLTLPTAGPERPDRPATTLSHGICPPLAAGRPGVGLPGHGLAGQHGPPGLSRGRESSRSARPLGGTIAVRALLTIPYIAQRGQATAACIAGHAARSARAAMWPQAES